MFDCARFKVLKVWLSVNGITQSVTRCDGHVMSTIKPVTICHHLSGLSHFHLLVCGVSELAVMVRCYRKTLRHWFDCLPALWKNLICSFPALIEKLPLLSKWQRTKARTAECLCASGPAMEWGLDQGLHPPPQPSAGKAVRKRMTGRITKNKQLPLSYYYPK